MEASDSRFSKKFKGAADERDYSIQIDSTKPRKKPVVVIFVGMAGCGKTTLVHNLLDHVRASRLHGFAVNLDPAVVTLPFDANIDIRDSFDYNDMMKQFNAGPGAGTLSCLNRLALNFDEQVISVIKEQADQLDYVLVDTPGLINIFTSSALGDIIVEAFASSFPTVLTYMTDTCSSATPMLWATNMFHALSLFEKIRLPSMIAINKIDTAEHKFDMEWMRNLESEVAARSDLPCTSAPTQILGFPTDKFSENSISVFVSDFHGSELDEFLRKIQVVAEDCTKIYKPCIDRRQEAEKHLRDMILLDEFARFKFQNLLRIGGSLRWFGVRRRERNPDEMMPFEGRNHDETVEFSDDDDGLE